MTQQVSCAIYASMLLRIACVAAVSIMTGWLMPGASANAAGGTLTDVYVDCSITGNDMVGGNFCFAIKEKLRGLYAFRLVEEPPNIGIGVHVVSLDPDANGALAGSQSSVAVALTTYAGIGSVEYFEAVFIIDVGAHRVQEMATSVLSHIGEVETDEHKLLQFQRLLRSSGK